LAKAASVERRTQMRREFFDETTPDWMHLLVETEKGEVVGFCDCGPVDRLKDYAPAEIYTIYLLRPAQRKGLGKRMFLMMLKHLAQRGFDSAVLDVFAENQGSRRFYERMGGKRISDIERDYGGTNLPLTVYVWPDLKKAVSL